jgi:hypothetical protein
MLPVLPRELWGPSLGAAWAASAAIISAYEPARLDDRLQAAPSDSAETLDRAARHGDEHVIKFSDTAVEVFDRTGHPDALAAAVRAGELIAPRG